MLENSLNLPPLTLHELLGTNAASPEAVAWDAFVVTCPGATFCHRAGWRQVIEAATGQSCFYRFVCRGGMIVGVLPLVHVRSPLFGNALISNGFCVYGGIAALDDQAAEALAADATALGERLGVDYVELRHQAPRLDWPGRSDLYATFRRPLEADEARNFLAIPRKKRADIRKSIGNGLKLVVDADIDEFYNIYAESVRNLGTPVLPRRFFHQIKQSFGTDAEVLLVRDSAGPLAALIAFYFRDQVLPYYGGALPLARPVHAYDFLYWSLMSRATKRGVRVFDFGRSKRGTGAFDYKTFWGFTPEPLHYQYHLIRATEPPRINPLNPRYRWLVAAWQRLPLGIANRLGPVIARGIG
ncbi:MAG: FemAB family XrtA/PEP-CTERM system-associated protein [Rhodospirillaceae bacterium]